MEVTTGVPIGQEAAPPFCSVGLVRIHTLATPFDNGLEVRLMRLRARCPLEAPHLTFGPPPARGDR